MALPARFGQKFFAAAALQTRQYTAPAERAIPAAKQKYVPTSGTYPKGFLVGSAHAGVKESNRQYDDVALVVSEEPCAAAAVFTLNAFRAAPVSVSQRVLRHYRSKEIKGDVRGVVVNSGCANAVTGLNGIAHAETMGKVVDRLCGEDALEVQRTLVMSTGVIGKPLPIDRISNAIPKAHASLGASHDRWLAAAKAICTTDTFPKLISRTFTLPSDPETTYSIAGMTKGAGMIHPNMATLLGIVCTDVKIDSVSLHQVLQTTIDKSFNSISIDGDTSTNDTVAMFANGAAAPASAQPLVFNPSENTLDTTAFLNVVDKFMVDLAQLVVRDGEGATKFVTVRVRTPNKDLGKDVANSVIRSPLVKTALYGKDANWGRILCATGYAASVIKPPKDRPADEQVQPHKTSVSFVPSDGSPVLKLLVRGEPQDVDEVRAKEVLELEDVEILIDLVDSDEKPSKEPVEVTAWTCDFSHEYVTINGDYRT